MAAKPGWYRSEHDPARQRYWTGSEWTAEDRETPMAPPAGRLRNWHRRYRLQINALALLVAVAFVVWAFQHPR